MIFPLGKLMMNINEVNKSLSELKLLVAQLEISLEKYDFEGYEYDPKILIPDFMKEISRIEIELLKNAFSG